MASELSVAPGAVIQCRTQAQIGRVPGAQAVIGGTDIAAVIAVGIFVALGHVRRARIGVDVAQHAQGVVGVLVRHSGGVVALFPEMAPPAQQPVEQHGAIPVEPVHQAWHVGGQRRSDQVVHVGAHDAHREKGEAELGACLFEAEQNGLARLGAT